MLDMKMNEETPDTIRVIGENSGKGDAWLCECVLRFTSVVLIHCMHQLSNEEEEEEEEKKEEEEIRPHIPYTII